MIVFSPITSLLNRIYPAALQRARRKEVRMNMTIEETCEYLRISKTTLWRWRKSGLPYFKFGEGGGRVLFNKAEVDEWLKENASKQI